jgi:hypothetical protein
MPLQKVMPCQSSAELILQLVKGAVTNFFLQTQLDLLFLGNGVPNILKRSDFAIFLREIQIKECSR